MSACIRCVTPRQCAVHGCCPGTFPTPEPSNGWPDTDAERSVPAAPAQPKLIGWRMADYANETSDPKMAKNWSAHVDVFPIFEGDPNTRLAAPVAPAEPVGCYDGEHRDGADMVKLYSDIPKGTLLYAAPVAAPVAPAIHTAPLSQDQIEHCVARADKDSAQMRRTHWNTHFARAIEAAHGIKP